MNQRNSFWLSALFLLAPASAQQLVQPSVEIEIGCTDSIYAPWASSTVAADPVYGMGLIGSPLYGENGAAQPSLLVDMETGTTAFEYWHPQGQTSGNFGNAVALAGEFAVVAAQYETGTHYAQGAVYVFSTYSGNLLYRLIAGDPGTAAWFGRSVALVQNRLVVGAPGVDGKGAAYVFDLNTGLQLMKLAPSELSSGDLYGMDVDIHGGRIVVGARDRLTSGRVFVHSAYSGTKLLVIAPPSGSWDFGRALSMHGLSMVVSCGTGSSDSVVYEYEIRYGGLLRTYTDPGTSGSVSSLFGRSVDMTGAYVGISQAFYSGSAIAQGRMFLYPRGTTTPQLELELDQPQQEDVLSDFHAIGLGHVITSSRRNSSANCHNSLAMVYRIDPQPGIPTAGKAQPDSSGYQPVLFYSGSNVVWHNNFNLRVSGMAPGKTAYFQASPTPAFLPGTSYLIGHRALGNPYFWLLPYQNTANSSGVVQFPVSFPYIHPYYPIAAQAGQTWYFQALCQRASYGYAYTNGLRVLFE